MSRAARTAPRRPAGRQRPGPRPQYRARQSARQRTGRAPPGRLARRSHQL